MGKIALIGLVLGLASMPLFALSLAAWLFNPFISLPAETFNLLVFSAHALAILGAGLIALNLFLSYVLRERKRFLRIDPICPLKISVGMTAYNDEGVIGEAVKDFVKAPHVVSVTVIDNNCVDRTAEEAREAGAKVVKETVQGFGAACQRALKEARKYGNLMVLVEGDQTFTASDLKKLTAYIENVDMVVGTRTTAEIIAPDSQVNWFMRYGNLFIAKLLQLKYWDQVRLTDVGCTFRPIRPEAFDKIVDQLKVNGNEFNPHMIAVAIKNGLKVVEVPVTLKKRAGESKGVGTSYIRGLETGLIMIKEIFLQ